MPRRFPINSVTSLQLFQAMQFGTAVMIGILLAKSGLPTGLISVYEALMFLASLACFFWVVGGQNTLLQLFPKLDESGRQAALFNVYALFTLAGAATGFVLFLSKNWVAGKLTSFDELPHLNLLALFLVFNPATFLIQIFYLLLKKYKAIVLFGVASFGIQLAVVVLPVYMGASLREVMIGLVAWAVFKYGWGLTLLARHARMHWDVGFVKKYLPMALPLLLFALIGKGSDYVSGLMVTTLFDDEKVFAIFRYGAREFPLAVLMVGALTTSLLPEVSGDLERGLNRIKQITRKLSFWLYPVSMASMLAAPLLFPLIFNPDFKDSARVFNIFTLLLTSRILMPQVVAMGQGKNYALTLVGFVELLVLTVLSWWLGRWIGLDGVAYAAVFSFMAGRIFLMAYLWKNLGIAPGRYVDWKSYLAFNAALIGVFLISLQY